jgi:hypothetical protein
MHLMAATLPNAAQSLLKDVEQVKHLCEKTGEGTELSEEDIDAAQDALAAAIKLIGKLS